MVVAPAKPPDPPLPKESPLPPTASVPPKVELPKTATSDQPANAPLAVTITKDGQYLYEKKPIEELEATSFPAAAVVSALALPAARPEGRKVDGAEALVALLRDEAKVL